MKCKHRDKGSAIEFTLLQFEKTEDFLKPTALLPKTNKYSHENPRSLCLEREKKKKKRRTNISSNFSTAVRILSVSGANTARVSSNAFSYIQSQFNSLSRADIPFPPALQNNTSCFTRYPQFSSSTSSSPPPSSFSLFPFFVFNDKSASRASCPVSSTT